MNPQYALTFDNSHYYDSFVSTNLTTITSKHQNVLTFDTEQQAMSKKRELSQVSLKVTKVYKLSRLTVHYMTSLDSDIEVASFDNERQANEFITNNGYKLHSYQYNADGAIQLRY